MASVAGADEALAAADAGAAIVAVPAGALAATRAAVSGRAGIATRIEWRREDGREFAEALAAVSSADMVLVGFEPGSLAEIDDSAEASAARSRRPERFAVFAADGADPGSLPLGSVKRAGFAGVALDLEATATAGGLTRRVSAAELARFSRTCRAHGLAVGFGGGLEAPDVPRLLPLRPHFLRFGAALERDGRVDPDAVRQIVRLLAGDPGARAATGETDRIFVRDLTLALEIGAYRSERGRRQRVRFTVEAEVARQAAVPAAMADVYSYDIIIDAIHALAGEGHVEFVETYADAIAARVLGDPRVAAVLVRVEKLDLGPAAAGIEIRRTR